MAESPEPSNGKKDTSKKFSGNAHDFSQKTALALELPFTLVGAVVVGTLIGFFLDRWLHTSHWFAVILGSLGFIGGVREVIRRLPAGGN